MQDLFDGKLNKDLAKNAPLADPAQSPKMFLQKSNIYFSAAPTALCVDSMMFAPRLCTGRDYKI
jgi:hypothetical protein